MTRTGGILLAALLMSGTALPALHAQQKSVELDIDMEHIDVNRLPIDLARIQRQLQESADREEREGLNLRYVVNIYGRRPVIEIIRPGENALVGPVPNSAPTHNEILDHITPKEFRSPVMDLPGAIKWLSDRLRGKTPSPR